MNPTGEVNRKFRVVVNCKYGEFIGEWVGVEYLTRVGEVLAQIPDMSLFKMLTRTGVIYFPKEILKDSIIRIEWDDADADWITGKLKNTEFDRVMKDD